MVLGDLAAALSFRDLALSLVRTLDHRDPLVCFEHASCEESLGETLDRCGRASEAVLAYERALLIHGTDSNKPRSVEGMLRTCGSLGNLYCTAGLPEKALQRLERAEGLLAHIPHSNEAAVTRVNLSNHLGRVLGSMGRHAEAADHFARAVRDSEHCYGKGAAAVALALVHLGTSNQLAGNSEKAISLIMSACHMLERRGEENTETYAHALKGLGACQSDPTRALVFYERSLAVLRSLLPGDHLHVALILQLVAKAKTALGRSEGATKAVLLACSAIRRSQTKCAGPNCELCIRPDAHRWTSVWAACARTTAAWRARPRTGRGRAGTRASARR